MLVHRLLRTQHLSLASHSFAYPVLVARDRPRLIDIIGLYADQRYQAAVFELVEPTPHVTLPPWNPALGISLSVSGAYLSDFAHARADDLVTLLPRLEERVSQVAHPSTSSRELLTFLQELYETAPAWADLHLILSPPGASQASGVAAFLERHSRFRLARVSAAVDWSDAVGQWLGHWRPGETHHASFRRLDACSLAIWHFLESDPKSPRGYRWIATPSTEDGAAPPRIRDARYPRPRGLALPGVETSPPPLSRLRPSPPR